MTVRSPTQQPAILAIKVGCKPLFEAEMRDFNQNDGSCNVTHRRLDFHCSDNNSTLNSLPCTARK